MGRSVIAWPRGLRWVAAALIAFAGYAAFQLGMRLVLDTFDGGLRAPPGVVFRGMVLFVVLPLGLVTALRWLFSARVEEDAAALRIAARFLRLEIPRDGTVRTRPWRIPLPSPGEVWALDSGERLPRELERISSNGTETEPRSDRVARAFASARLALHRTGMGAYALKYGLFPLLPAAAIFYSYQRITFGGWNAEYQLFGLKAWLTSAGAHWAVTLAHLVVIAGALRVAAELVSFSAAWVHPGSTRGVRLGAEWCCRVVYYGGIPGLLALRFLV